MSPKPRYKYVTAIICPNCDDRIWSYHRHDMRSCSCGYCYIDGGRDYTRVGYNGEMGFGPPKSVRMRVTLQEYGRAAKYESIARWPY